MKLSAKFKKSPLQNLEFSSTAEREPNRRLVGHTTCMLLFIFARKVIGKAHKGHPNIHTPLPFFELLRSQAEFVEKRIPQVIFVCSESYNPRQILSWDTMYSTNILTFRCNPSSPLLNSLIWRSHLAKPTLGEQRTSVVSPGKGGGGVLPWAI